MNMCQAHWDKLRAAIDERGLSGLVPQTGETAAMQAVDQLQRDEATPTNFDPLMNAAMAIFSQAMDRVGLVLLQPDEDGNMRCPICFLVSISEAQGAPPEMTALLEEWIDHAANDSLAGARHLGLIAEASS